MERQLNVTVFSANLIKDVCIFGKMDPIFSASISNKSCYISKKRKGEGKNPKWNEKLSFKYNGERELSIEIKHDKKSVNYY